MKGASLARDHSSVKKGRLAKWDSNEEKSHPKVGGEKRGGV